jgi:hypothetical protein
MMLYTTEMLSYNSKTHCTRTHQNPKMLQNHEIEEGMNLWLIEVFNGLMIMLLSLGRYL